MLRCIMLHPRCDVPDALLPCNPAITTISQGPPFKPTRACLINAARVRCPVVLIISFAITSGCEISDAWLAFTSSVDFQRQSCTVRTLERRLSLETGSEADCFGRFEAAVADKRCVVIPLWHPQFLHHRYTIRALEEPKGCWVA